MFSPLLDLFRQKNKCLTPPDKTLVLYWQTLIALFGTPVLSDMVRVTHICSGQKYSKHLFSLMWVAGFGSNENICSFYMRANIRSFYIHFSEHTFAFENTCTVSLTRHLNNRYSDFNMLMVSYTILP